MSPLHEDDLRSLLQVRDPGVADDAALAAAAIEAGKRTQRRRAAAAVTTVAALTVAAVVISPLLSPTVTTLPIAPASTPSSSQTRTTPTQTPSASTSEDPAPTYTGPYSAIDALPAQWGQMAHVPGGTPRPGWSPLDFTLSCTMGRGEPTNIVFFPEGGPRGGRTIGEDEGRGVESALLFVEGDAGSEFFMANLAEQAEACAADPDEVGDNDGTRDRWSVDTPDEGYLLITIATEARIDGEWQPMRPGAAVHVLFGIRADSVGMASGAFDPEHGHTLDEHLDALRATVDVILRL